MKFTGKWVGSSKHYTEVTWAQKDKYNMFSLIWISRWEQILVRSTNRKGVMGMAKKRGWGEGRGGEDIGIVEVENAVVKGYTCREVRWGRAWGESTQIYEDSIWNVVHSKLLESTNKLKPWPTANMTWLMLVTFPLISCIFHKLSWEESPRTLHTGKQ